MEKHIEYLKKIIIEVQNSIEQIANYAENQINILSISLCSSIFENTVACMSLLENKMYSSIPLLLRSIVEAYIDLVNLSKDKNYYNYIVASYYKEHKRLLKNILDDPNSNRFFIKSKSMPDLQKKLQDAERDLNQLIAQGYSPLNIKEKFEKADMSELYGSVYYLLCQEFHNDPKALESRHIDMKNRKVTIFMERSIEEIHPYIDSLAGVLVLSFQSVLKILGLQEGDHFKKALALLNELRAETKP